MKLNDIKYITEIKQYILNNIILYLKYIFNKKMGIFFINVQYVAYPYIIINR